MNVNYICKNVYKIWTPAVIVSTTFVNTGPPNCHPSLMLQCLIHVRIGEAQIFGKKIIFRASCSSIVVDQLTHNPKFEGSDLAITNRGR